jgi:hypothetical protein
MPNAHECTFLELPYPTDIVDATRRLGPANGMMEYQKKVTILDGVARTCF